MGTWTWNLPWTYANPLLLELGLKGNPISEPYILIIETVKWGKGKNGKLKFNNGYHYPNYHHQPTYLTKFDKPGSIQVNPSLIQETCCPLIMSPGFDRIEHWWNNPWCAKLTLPPYLCKDWNKTGLFLANSIENKKNIYHAVNSKGFSENVPGWLNLYIAE